MSKKVILSVIAAAAAGTALIPSSYEKSFISYDTDGTETETVISWSFSRDRYFTDDHGIQNNERYFSIENYYAGDIENAFYAGVTNKSYVHPYTKEFYSWHVFQLEAYKDVDDAWINIEIGF